jgi:hypothetical protein
VKHPRIKQQIINHHRYHHRYHHHHVPLNTQRPWDNKFLPRPSLRPHPPTHPANHSPKSGPKCQRGDWLKSARGGEEGRRRKTLFGVPFDTPAKFANLMGENNKQQKQKAEIWEPMECPGPLSFWGHGTWQRRGACPQKVLSNDICSILFFPNDIIHFLYYFPTTFSIIMFPNNLCSFLKYVPTTSPDLNIFQQPNAFSKLCSNNIS